MQYRFQSSRAKHRLLNPESQNRVLFADVEYDGGIIRMHTSIGDKMLNGHVYKGVGEILSISDPSEEEGVNPSRISMSMLFNDESVFADIMNNDPTGNHVTLYTALYDDNWQLIEAPVFFSGDMDAPELVDHVNLFSVSVNITDFFEIWKRPIEAVRMSDAAHQAKHPGDLIFNQVETLARQGIKDAVPGKYVGGGPGGSFSRLIDKLEVQQ